MIDIHTHLLFGVDDGPQTMEETLKMIEKAHSEGITDLICTSHAYHPQYNVEKPEVLKQTTSLTTALVKAGHDIKLHPGQEIRLTEDIIDKFDRNELLTLANSQYLLLELPSQTVPAYTVNIIHALLERETIPIIAHPERNRAIAEKPQRLEKLIRHGATAQITAGSLSGHFGKNIQRLSLRLIESNLIHTYGSDVHNLKTRPFHFGKGLDFLEKKRLYDIADLLLANNERILNDEPLLLLEPELQKPRKFFGLIG
ncbi:capsular polysaccharide biosynthesis protein Cap8C [Sporosarcina luteola]|uniref:Tyrosine-protein phosphatase n=1 Tax=Sporosarcina luteola TaxID=582850 RepID=A0A511Z2Z0_9BACL|nr:CpsB/CapC family capsule biosynthesis tyrosine phosphatase [Sporosarcina luteola]GEN81812.1 capsular polysaccharide biosynthesis protein Cap8C [Sporosarcina luteola]